MLKSEFMIGLIAIVLVILVWIGFKACKSLNDFYENVLTPHCHICGCETEVEMSCSRCDEYCCEECALKNTYLNPIEEHCCGNCGLIYFD